MVCVGLQQFAELAAFFSVPASSRKFRPLATNQKVVSSNLSVSKTRRVENSLNYPPTALSQRHLSVLPGPFRRMDS